MSETTAAIINRVSFDALRRFAPRKRDVEVCEVCSAPFGAAHQHLIEMAARKIVCACDACAILFNNPITSRYRTIPRSGRLLNEFEMTVAQWDALAIPIGLAFFFKSSSDDGDRVVAFYPSPAGATESLLDLTAWGDLVAINPILSEMQPDVEALLVNRIGAAREYYLAPIDDCYRLVGLIRTNWRGLSGGEKVWQEIAEFFGQLRQKCVA